MLISKNPMEKIKVHLVFSPPLKMPKFGELSEGRIPPLGIMYIASYLRKKFHNIDIKITDGVLFGLEKTIREIEHFQPNILGLSVYTPVALGSYNIATRIKEKNPSTLIVAGGPHPSALPEDALNRSAIDIVVRGEGEITFYELVELFRRNGHFSTPNLSKIDGISFRMDNSIYHTPNRPRITNLDLIPFPSRDLINLSHYKGWYLNKEASEGAIITSRGCPYYCTFCSNSVWKTNKPYTTFRSPQNVANEIEELYLTYGIREICDVSDEFNSNPSHSIAICEEMKRRNLNIRWKANMRAHPLPEDLVKLMAETGCWYVLLGIESGNQETIKGIQKHISFEQVERACDLFHKYNIKVMGLFMLYNVWEENGILKYEGTEAIKNTFRYIKYMMRKGFLDYIGWSVAVPYPGSKLFDIACRHHLIKKEYKDNWDDWLRKDSYVMQLPGQNKKEQMRMKTVGSIIRAKLILKNHDFKLKDLGLFFRKALRLTIDEISSLFQNRHR